MAIYGTYCLGESLKDVKTGKINKEVNMEKEHK